MKRPELYEALLVCPMKTDNKTNIVAAFDLAIGSAGIVVTRPKPVAGGANSYTLAIGVLRSTNIQNMLLTPQQLDQFMALISVMASNYNTYFTKPGTESIVYNVMANEGLI